MTMADWAELSRELAEYVPWAPILVTFFLVVSGFIFLNLIVALICEAMGSIHNITANIDVGNENITLTNLLDRIQNIEEGQKYVSDVIKTCTITANLECPNPGPSGVVYNPAAPSLKKKRKWVHLM